MGPIQRILLLSGLFLLVACQADTPLRTGLNDTLIVWHTWREPESLLLNELLDEFSMIHPNVSIVSEYVSRAELLERFPDQLISGLGPDVLIGLDVREMSEFVDRGFIRDVTGRTDTSLFARSSVDAFTLDEQLYGIPFSAYTHVLYYDKEAITEPVDTLDGLLLEAQAGHHVAIPTTFYDSFWGIKAFGGNVFGEDNSIIADDGFEQWLMWLLSASADPNIVLANEYVELRQLFAEGEVSYFVGDSFDLPSLRVELGEERVGVAHLPNGTASAGGFVELEAIAISRISAETELALQLIEFLTNTPHQRKLAFSEVGRIPLNTEVTVDERFAPDEAILLEQSQYGVIVPLSAGHIEQTLLDVGDQIYLEVLQGLLTPQEAVRELPEKVDARLGRE